MYNTLRFLFYLSDHSPVFWDLFKFKLKTDNLTIIYFYIKKNNNNRKLPDKNLKKKF